MSFRISVSPQRKRSNTGMSQTARTQRKSIHSSLNAIIEEIKSQMKQLNPEFQNLLLQLFRIAFELEKQNIKYQNAQQSSKANSIHQIDSFQKEPSQHQERIRSKESSPIKRDSTSRCAEMTSSTKLDPTPKQKFLIRRNTFEIDHQISKDQLRKISQEAIDFNFIFNLLDFKTCNLKSMNYKKFNQIFTLNEQDLYQYIQKTDYQEYLLYLYEPIKFIKELSTKTIQYIEKLKKIIKLQFEISKCSPSQIFEQYQTLLQQTFECDRTQILLYDSKANQFWTKSNQATQKIYYQFKGIPAFVKNKGQLLNLSDVYQDVRFDQEYDLKQGVKTKTMLACPIENQGEIIGVIMISSSTYQYKKDDELIMQIIAQSCTLHFSQFITQELNSKTCESLQQILKFSILLQQSIDQKQFMILAQEILLKSYQLKQVQIFFKDMQDVESLFTYVNQQRKKVPKSCGIIGYVYKTGQLYVSDSCYKDRYFNKLADIETNLPTITLPVKDDDKCMGVIQYIDTKGIDNLVGKNIKNNQLSNIDLLLTFANMLNYVNNKLIIQK